MTCNLEWPEIQRALQPGQPALERPDVIQRVWRVKLAAFVRRLGTLFPVGGHYIHRYNVLTFVVREWLYH